MVIRIFKVYFANPRRVPGHNTIELIPKYGIVFITIIGIVHNIIVIELIWSWYMLILVIIIYMLHVRNIYQY